MTSKENNRGDEQAGGDKFGGGWKLGELLLALFFGSAGSVWEVGVSVVFFSIGDEFVRSGRSSGEEYVRSVRQRFGCASPRNPWPALPASLASWTRALVTPPARPPVVTTRSQLSSTLPLNLVTTPLRWKSVASFLAQIYGLRTSSLQPSATRTPLWTSESSHRTPSRLAQIALAPG